MLSTSLSRRFVALLAAAMLTGCAAPAKRSLETDSAVRSVAIVSLLNERTTVDRIGLTVFNNKSVVIDQTGVLNPLAVETLDSALRKARPSWQIKDARSELPALLAAKQAGGVAWTSAVSDIAEPLAAAAAKLDVDLLFVVVDHNLENAFGRGVGALLRTMNLSSVNELRVHALALVVLVDRNGNPIINRWGGPAAFATVPAADLGIDYDMTSLSSQETQAKLKAMMQERLRASLTSAASSMGY